MRGPGRGLLFLLVLLAAGGVAVAGVLRPGLDPRAAEAERTAATVTGPGDEAISLAELEPRAGPEEDGDSEGMDDPGPRPRA